MLSNLPKLADRNFVIGFFLPALFGLVAAAWAFPNAEFISALRDLEISNKDLKDLLYLFLTTWLSAVLLMTGNYWLYRLYEGYTWPIKWMPWLRKFKVKKWSRITGRYQPLMRKYSEDKAPLSTTELTRLVELAAMLHSDFPTKEADILPTEFGNRIRAFEVYSRDVYGADSIPVWDRLVSVIPKAFMESITENRAQVDFYLNISFIAISIFFAQVGNVLWALGSDVRVWTGRSLLEVVQGRPVITLLSSITIAVLSYFLASHAVLNWGRSVKSAFDCFLPALLTQMGYEIPTSAARKEFWTEFSQLASYGDPVATIWPLHSAEPTKPGQAEPAGSKPEEESAEESAEGE